VLDCVCLAARMTTAQLLWPGTLAGVLFVFGQGSKKDGVFNFSREPYVHPSCVRLVGMTYLGTAYMGIPTERSGKKQWLVIRSRSVHGEHVSA